MTGYQITYLVATVSQGFSALAKTATYFLLRFFIDTYLAGASHITLPWLAFSFLIMAGIEGGFSFLSGTFAARTAEGVTRRLRNYLFDHIQHLTFTYHDSIHAACALAPEPHILIGFRRFFADQITDAAQDKPWRLIFRGSPGESC